MATLTYFLLAILAAFLLIASVPLITQAVEATKEEFADRGWAAVPGLTLRSLLWLVLGFFTICFVIILGLFGGSM